MDRQNTTSYKKQAVPLSLYIHFPWCLRKCPYCDFNSYVIYDKSYIAVYVNKLLIDLENTVSECGSSELISVYFGGGTPSLLPPEAITSIIQQVRKFFRCIPNIEITLEANPGTISLPLCQAFKQAGINRLSLGIQSFNDEKLRYIKRIHDAKAALDAVHVIKQSGFTDFNLDFMYGLPGQNMTEAVNDLKMALEFEPPHISWYQLTLDNVKKFGGSTPGLPHGEELWEIQQAGQEFLAKHGLKQYEVSAYCNSLADRCIHNMNYWLYGDYLGIGAGACGKITLNGYSVKRYMKIADPFEYLKSNNLIATKETVAKEKLPLEFMLNALRLYQPISYDLFRERTGFTIDVIKKQLQSAEDMELIELRDNAIYTTGRGKNFLNDLLEYFL